MSFVLEQNTNVFKTKFTTSGGFIVTLLGLALLALGERVLYDTGRLLAPPPLDYFNNVNVIGIHAVVVIIFLILALSINLTLGAKKERYAVALVPYYVVSILLACQLLLQVTVYFYNHHTDLQFYLVMVCLVLVCTYALYWMQKRFAVQSN